MSIKNVTCVDNVKIGPNKSTVLLKRITKGLLSTNHIIQSSEN